MSFGRRIRTVAGAYWDVLVGTVAGTCVVMLLTLFSRAGSEPEQTAAERPAHTPIPTAVRPSPTRASRLQSASGAATQARPSFMSTSPRATTPTVKPTTDLSGVFDAAFVRDVTIPDDTRLKPGTSFAKAWRFRNTGSRAWPKGTMLVWVGGKRMGAPKSVLVPTAQPGQTVDVSVHMVVPVLEERHRGDWRLCIAEGCFGTEVFVQVIATHDTKPPTAALRTPAAVLLPATRVLPPTPTPQSPPPELGFTCSRCIKGNIGYGSGERIYHIPGCPYYDATDINTAYGERWFSSEAEAVAAGWRKAYNCP